MNIEQTSKKVCVLAGNALENFSNVDWPMPSQNTNVYHMVVQCSQMFANIKHSITVFNDHLFDVCEDSSKCEKRLCLAGL